MGRKKREDLDIEPEQGESQALVLLKKAVGRPAKFTDPNELRSHIKKYFKETPFEKLTVTGLALSCGTSRLCLDNYQKKPGFEDIITMAKCIVENSYETSMREKGRTTDIFALKNFGWKDETIHDNKHSGEVKTGINWIQSANIVQKKAVNAIVGEVPKILLPGEEDE